MEIAKQSMQMTRWLRRSYIVMGVLILAAVIACIREWQFITQAAKAVGDVAYVDMDHIRVPVINFKTEAGEEYTVIGHETMLIEYKQGLLVPVLYMRDNPGEYKLDLFMQRWGATAWFVLMIFCNGLFSYFIARYRQLMLQSSRGNALYRQPGSKSLGE